MELFSWRQRRIKVDGIFLFIRNASFVKNALKLKEKIMIIAKWLLAYIPL